MRPCIKGWARLIALTAMVSHAALGGAAGPAAADPFATSLLTASGPAGSLARSSGAVQPCQWPPQEGALSLPEVVDRALCHNPQTREAWANARFQASQVGIAQSAFLPSANLSLTPSRNFGSNESYSQTTATLSLSYLLYDFGGREAALENARQILAATNATQDATLQSVFLAAVQAYYQWFAAQASVAAAKESERASQESLKAAISRYSVGTATPADKLQAQTAASQATLTRIRAEGSASSAQGTLANAMGLPADQPLAIAPPSEILPDQAFEAKVGELIATAKRLRPDLAAAEAQVAAAKAGIASARAAGMPSISLFANSSASDNTLSDPLRNNAIGVTISIPLFSGYESTYRIRAAEEALQIKQAQHERITLQVALDVWRAYQALLTENQAVRAAADLLASASESERVAQGRYRAGVGGILDLLNAQSALVNARQQHIQELYNWRLARITLAQAMGQLDFAALDAASK